MTGDPAREMEDLLQFLYLMPVGVVKFRAAGAVDMMNPTASALLLAANPADNLENIYFALAPLLPDLRQLVAAFVGPAGTIVDQQRVEARAMTLALTVNKIKDDVFMAVLQDETRLAQRERQLYADRRKFFAIFDHVRDYAIYTITLDGITEEWNQSLQRYGGWLAADVQGRGMDVFFPPDDPDRPSVVLLLAEALRTGSVETEGWRVRRDGSRLWANSVITALPDEAGTVCGYVVVSRDMTERKRWEDNMQLLATVDTLTGAHNRRQGNALLALEFSRRARGGQPFALLMLDIDNFKGINDRYGHPAGDEVLRALVRTCRAGLRPVDTVARWGGEEFLAILPDTDAAAAIAAAERVRAALAATAVDVPGGKVIHFTASIGVAVSGDSGPEELISRTDIALYAAKTGGRNRVMLAP